jgi:hypothetical protein
MDKTNFSKKAGLLMAGCLITLNAFGQATIKGQVVDATGEPVKERCILLLPDGRIILFQQSSQQ